MMMTGRGGMGGLGIVRDPDLLGAAVSGLCVVHCVLLPAAPAALPALALALPSGEVAEPVLLGTTAALAAVVVGLGYRRHRAGRVVALVAAGLGLLAAGRVAESRGFGWPAVASTVAGGLAVAASHLLNRRLCRSCPRCLADRAATADGPAPCERIGPSAPDAAG